MQILMIAWVHAVLAMLFVLALPGAGAQGVNDRTQVAQAVATQPAQPGEVGVVPWRSQRFGTYEALVIGINGYSHLSKAEQLTTAINDANAVTKLLVERYGFNVKVLRNARRQTILTELARLRTDLTEADHLLLYYAGRGHVDSENKRCYWWPSDANPNDPATWIANAEVTDQLKAMKAAQVLIVADSCYTGTQPYSSQAPAAGEKRDVWLQRLAKMRARTVLTSGSLQPLAQTDESEHSIFANAFMQALRTNDRVIEAAHLLATLGSPATYASIDGTDHRDGDFLFVPRNR